MPATAATDAPLIEIFSSLQGEGVLIGCRQVFVRFALCNLDCAYCDTLFQPSTVCRIEVIPGSGDFTSYGNPVNLEDVTRLIAGWEAEKPGMHHSLVLTGGEPLLHADVLCRWLPVVAEILPVYLETNGTLPKALGKILSTLRWISMDIKGGAVTGQSTPWEEHAAFLALAAGKLCQVKLVVDHATTRDELLQAADLVAQLAPDIPFVLQPRTSAGRPAMSGVELLGLQAAAAARHRDVRIIPQVHPWLGVA